MSKIDQVFIFSAGRGQRMAPITDTIPKPLIKVKGKSLLDHIIDKIPSNFNKIIVNGFYLADKMQEHLKLRKDEKIAFSRENEKIETGGGLVFAAKNRKFNENKPILLINGDLLWFDDGQIEEICDFYDKNPCDILLGLTKTGQYYGYEGQGDFNLVCNSQKIETASGGQKTHVFVGLQVINPRILNFAPKDQKCFSMNYFYKLSEIDLRGIELSGKFYHIGDEKALKGVVDELR